MNRFPACVDRPNRARDGFTVVELLMVIGITSILAALLLPAVQAVREASRRGDCASHLRQVMQATTAFEATHAQFPEYSTGTLHDDGTVKNANNSPLVQILPQIDQAHVYRGINHEHPVSGANGYAPPTVFHEENRPFLSLTIPLYQCPSDRDLPGSCNVRANLGSGVSWRSMPDRPCNDPRNGNGAFATMESLTAAVFVDGLSNTVFYSERVIGDQDNSTYDPWRDFSRAEPQWPSCTGAELANTCAAIAGIAPSVGSYSGSTWLYAAKSQTAYDHILTPNSRTPDCSVSTSVEPSIGHSVMTARSQHPGLVNAVLGDAAVREVSESIDLKVWQALGSRADRD